MGAGGERSLVKEMNAAAFSRQYVCAIFRLAGSRLQQRRI